MKKKHLVLGIVALVAIAVIVLVYVLGGPKPTIDPTDTSVVGQTTTTTVAVEDIHKEEQTTTSTSVRFLEPNESEADKLLQEHQSRTTTSAVSTTKASTVTTTKQTTTARTEKSQSFEEGKKELENTASEYLKEHNIDPRTAGETGEVCSHCGKKIWDPDKYGFFIPGMPDDYENSGYCLGTCGITFG